MSLSFQIKVFYCMSNLPILMVCSCLFNYSAFASVKKSSNLPGLFLVNKNMFPLLLLMLVVQGDFHSCQNKVFHGVMKLTQTIFKPL